MTNLEKRAYLMGFEFNEHEKLRFAELYIKDQVTVRDIKEAAFYYPKDEDIDLFKSKAKES